MASQPNSIELLAPAGKWETMIEVLAAGADAVYLGGKRYNMRLLRANHNFTDAELEAAVIYTHERNKKLYVTVNNLFYQDEIAALEEYLMFLRAIGVDAIIVQDLAVASLVKKTVPDLLLHASVQMGVANSAAANWLQTQGFSRTILSKNVSQPEIKAIHQATPLELEYFIHGDVCISHTGQCYLSAMIFGASGNRGCCKKPCRWQYRLEGDREHSTGYYLAHNDLCLIEHIPELVDAGVVSLKIEGRMRDADYLCQLITAYRQVLDDINPSATAAATIKSSLQASRVRDFTTAGFTHRPSLVDIGLSGEREPAFPTAPVAILPQQLASNELPPETATSHLQVQVNTKETMNAALVAGVKTIVVGGNGSYPLPTFDLSVAVMMTNQAGAELVYQLPRVVTEAQLFGIQSRLDYLSSIGVTTVLVSDLGSMQLAFNQGFRIWGDYSLNLTNAEAIAFLKLNPGVERITAALELPKLELGRMVPASPLPVDMLIHGWLPGMVTDLCLRGAVDEHCPREQPANSLSLIDNVGNQYPLVCDQDCHHYVYYPYKLSLLGHLSLLSKIGINGLRLDLTDYKPEQVLTVVAIYQKAILAKSDELVQLQQDLSAATGFQYTDAPFFPLAGAEN
ncbi:MAG: U32 family peptidase [Methanomassiliicoccales archaeon]